MTVENPSVWISALTGICGVVVGALLSHYLARSSRRQEAILDLKRTEFRELLAAINGGFAQIMALKTRPPFFRGVENDRMLIEAEAGVAAAIAGRIFIAKDIAELNVMQRWSTSARRFDATKDIVTFGVDVSKLTEDIRKVALTNMGFE
jgi:hypothetical protein